VTRPFKVGVALAAGLGAAIRLVTLQTVAARNPDGFGDPAYYHEQAKMLVGGQGFGEPFRWTRLHLLVPSASHPPLYTIWLAIPSALGFDSWTDHKLMTCLAGVLTVVVIALVGREVAGDRAGIIAAVVAAAYPNFWMIDGILMPEGLFTLAIAGCLWLAYRWRRSPRWGWAAALGAGIALAALTRGEAVLLLALLVLPLVALRPQLTAAQKLRTLAVAGAATLVVLAPWMIRNYGAFHNFVPLSNNSNEVIYYANCPDTYSGRLMGFWSFPCQARDRIAHGEPPGDESDKALYWRKKGIRYALDHKGRVPVVVAARMGRMWDVYRPFQNAEFTKVEGRTEWVSDVGLIYYWAMLPAAAVGLVVLRRRRVSVVPLVAMAALVTLTAVYAYGAVRFRTPADVAIAVLVGVAADGALRRWRHRPGQAGDFGADAQAGEMTRAQERR